MNQKNWSTNLDPVDLIYATRTDLAISMGVSTGRTDDGDITSGVGGPARDAAIPIAIAPAISTDWDQ